MLVAAILILFFVLLFLNGRKDPQIVYGIVKNSATTPLIIYNIKFQTEDSEQTDEQIKIIAPDPDAALHKLNNMYRGLSKIKVSTCRESALTM